MLKVFCRLYQLIMKIGNYFIGFKTPECIEGPDSVLKLNEILVKNNLLKPLIVTNQNLIDIGLLEKTILSLNENNVQYTLFSNVSPNPTSDNVEEGYKIYLENNCDCLIAFGGGSPIDCAKAIGAKIVKPKKTINQLQGLLKVKKDIPTLIAIPTTAGTGSETTVAAVITDSTTHHKKSINDPKILPKYAILDPLLTINLPPSITSTTGLDTLCHAIESYTNHKYNTKLENEFAKEAVKLIHDNLYVCYMDGKNVEARSNMQKAAFLAGRAFTRGCVGNVHAIGHTLSGLYNVPHGLAMAILLPHILESYGKKVYFRLSELADVCGIQGNTKKEKSLNFIAWIKDLNQKMSIPSTIDMVKENDIPTMAKWAYEEANPLYPVPVIYNKKQFEKIIRSLIK